MIKRFIVDSTCNNMRFDRWFRNKLGKIPQGLIEKTLRTGKIKINKKKVKSSFKVKTDDKVDIFNFNFKEIIVQKNKVTVIIPAFNAKGTISESIQSVLCQSYQNFEIIIIDDGSTDGTSEYIINIFHDSRIIIKSIKNSGVAEARNTGMKLASGNFIAFLDSDDIWEKNKLERQISFMKERDISFSFTAYQIIDQKENIIGKREATDVLNFNQLLNSCDIGLSTS